MKSIKEKLCIHFEKCLEENCINCSNCVISFQKLIEESNKKIKKKILKKAEETIDW